MIKIQSTRVTLIQIDKGEIELLSSFFQFSGGSYSRNRRILPIGIKSIGKIDEIIIQI